MRMLQSPTDAVHWLRSRVAGRLQTDSRKVGAGDGFIAWPGASTDGRWHVREALQSGAKACLVESEGVEAFGFEDEAVASYASLKAATGPLASLYFDEPSRELDVVAITGTNGKTSTAWWLAQALTNLPPEQSIPCAVVGTLGTGRPPALAFNGMTTPDPVLFQAQLRRFVSDGAKACAVEASSIGLAEKRLDGTHIKTAVFTNFTQDHLDYHHSMSDYWEAKRLLFGWSGLQTAVVNLDDPKGRELVDDLRGRGVDVWTYAVGEDARLKAADLCEDALGLQFSVIEGEQSFPWRHHVIGRFNVSNLLAVMGVMRAMGVTLVDAVNACRALTPVPGRLESQTRPGLPMVVIDYAHTPDALEKSLDCLRPMADQRRGALWCVFGCGGDRDASKRPLMGAVAERRADRLVLTSDNPRNESPAAIVEQIASGLVAPSQAHIELDRGKAIEWVMAAASPQDIILLAGKGHEDYQEIQGVRLPFSDRLRVSDALQGTSPVLQPLREGAA